MLRQKCIRSERCPNQIVGGGWGKFPKRLAIVTFGCHCRWWWWREGAFRVRVKGESGCPSVWWPLEGGAPPSNAYGGQTSLPSLLLTSHSRIDGGREGADIQRGDRRQQREVRHCNRGAATHDPGQEGRRPGEPSTLTMQRRFTYVTVDFMKAQCTSIVRAREWCPT